MALRGTTPVAEEQRPKVFLFGEAGVGKTTAALQFPRPYVIDAEQGTSTDQYVDLIVAGGGASRPFEGTDGAMKGSPHRLERGQYRTNAVESETCELSTRVPPSPSLPSRRGGKQGNSCAVTFPLSRMVGGAMGEGDRGVRRG